MNENLKWGAVAAVFIGLAIGAVIYVDRKPRKLPPEETPTVAVPAKPAAPPEPAIKHPVPQAEAPEPLPKLDESDKPVKDAFEPLLGNEFVERFVVPDRLVRNFVVTVDNLPTEKVAERIRPLRPTSGAFVVGGSEDEPVLDPENYKRYEPLVKLVSSLDTKSMVATYTRYYPLFQESYESLGHPPEYFNDRLVEVIDHLLAAPEPAGPIRLARPGVQYKFADPELESRSAGQKALIRMGPENAKVIKAKLRELREVLVAQQPGERPAR